MQSHEQSRLRHNLIAILSLIAAVTIILLFASGLSTLTLRPGGSLNTFVALMEQIRPAELETTSTSPLTTIVSGRPVLDFMRIIFWALLALALIYAFISPQFRRQLIRSAVFMAVMLFVIMRLREMMNPAAEEETPAGLPPSDLPPIGSGATLPEPPALVTATPEWIVWTINILLALFIVLLVWLLWRKFRPQADEDNTQVQVAQQAEVALSELEEGGDLRDVILRCYTQMSIVLHEKGHVERHSAMTARDFEGHLARLGFDSEHISRLTRLFEAARYSSGTPDPEAEAEAVACLTSIAHEYGQEDAAILDRTAMGRRGLEQESVGQQA